MIFCAASSVLNGDEFVGMEIESVGGGVVAAGERALERSASGGETKVVAHGFQYVSRRDDTNPVADCDDGPTNCVSVVGLESVAIYVLPLARSVGPAVALLSRFFCSRSSDAPVRRIIVSSERLVGVPIVLLRLGPGRSSPRFLTGVRNFCKVAQ